MIRRYEPLFHWFSSYFQPTFIRKDTLSTVEIRIRNLFYPSSVYDVSIDDPNQNIVVRTSNKKYVVHDIFVVLSEGYLLHRYFKRISIPEISELGIQLNARSLTWQYGNNTLLLVYRKPAELMDKEEKDR
jgi:protein DPCD